MNYRIEVAVITGTNKLVDDATFATEANAIDHIEQLSAKKLVRVRVNHIALFIPWTSIKYLAVYKDYRQK